VEELNEEESKELEEVKKLLEDIKKIRDDYTSLEREIGNKKNEIKKILKNYYLKILEKRMFICRYMVKNLSYFQNIHTVFDPLMKLHKALTQA